MFRQFEKVGLLLRSNIINPYRPSDISKSKNEGNKRQNTKIQHCFAGYQLFMAIHCSCPLSHCSHCLGIDLNRISLECFALCKCEL